MSNLNDPKRPLTHLTSNSRYPTKQATMLSKSMNKPSLRAPIHDQALANQRQVPSNVPVSADSTQWRWRGVHSWSDSLPPTPVPHGALCMVDRPDIWEGPGRQGGRDGEAVVCSIDYRL
jgi:hypothetical protein